MSARPDAVPFVVVDVFTTTRFGGNPLAVITDARGLTDAQMQRIAAEFNHSETTFVLPPDDPAHDARVRIFTRTAEVPFAGHPNVGTAYVLARQPELFGRPTGASMRFEEGAGPVDVDILHDGGAVAGATIRAPRPLAIGATHDPAAIARCLSLPVDAIDLRHHRPTSVSVGLPFVVVETDPRSLSRARPDAAAFAQAARSQEESGLRFAVFVYARTDGDSIDRLRTRMFAPLGGTVEDPATGSASAALGAFLASIDPRADARVRVDIVQGVEMGRPSDIGVDVRKARGRVEDVRITGRCVPVMRGMLETGERV